MTRRSPSARALQPRKAPRQRRSADTVETILTAATRVLGRESLAGFNTNRVAEVAGVSVGSLYQYFPNKAALVAALIDRAQESLAQSVERVIADTASATLPDALRALARLAIAQQYSDPIFAAALDHEEKRLPIQSKLAQSERRIVEAVEGLLARHRASLPADLPAMAAVDCLVIKKALVEAQAAMGTPTAQDLEDRVVRALWGYLTTRSP